MNNKKEGEKTDGETPQTCNDDILERLALLENEFQSLQKEVKRYKANEELKDLDSDSVATIHTSFTSTDVFQVGENRSNDSDEKIRQAETYEVNMNERQPRSFKLDNSFITKRINADDDYKALSEDTFTMMIMSKPGSKQWWYAFSIFSIQIALLTMILHDQYKYSYITTPFDVPYRVSIVLHAGQLLAILLSLATQTDLVIAIITFIMLWERRRMYWTKVVEVAEDSHMSIWTLRVALPLACKFIEGVLVLLTTFVIVIQSDSMIELFKDFAAMQLISELDNMMFWLALHGYAGTALMNGAKRAQKVRIKDDVVKTYCGIPLRTMVLVVLFLFMFSGWVYILNGQVNGSFFYMKFPHCSIPEWKVASMGDGICDGGSQNTIGCNFDDGDCLAFNIAYPGCKVVETYRVGDGECDPEFNLPECGFDGGDCCPVADSELLGDGYCDGFVFNTEICGFDNGDCLDFNANYPRCCGLENYTLLELYNEYHRNQAFAIGDGKCDGSSMYNVPECGYDGGDCEECFQVFAKEFKEVEGFEDSFGDGRCDGASPLNIEICGYDGGDCYQCMVEEAIHDPSFNASRLGDGTCDGGVYMEESCHYDGGDCFDFVVVYPFCNAEDPKRIGDDVCDSEFDVYECGYDGGDCEEYREKFNLVDCHVDDIHRVGDGNCDGGEYATEGCLFDGGDCDGCQGNLAWIGDGACDGVAYMTEECGYDGGDCDMCIVKDISKVGDGTCDKELNTPECYYDGADCLGEGGSYDDDDSTGVFGGGSFGGTRN